MDKHIQPGDHDHKDQKISPAKRWEEARRKHRQPVNSARTIVTGSETRIPMPAIQPKNLVLQTARKKNIAGINQKVPGLCKIYPLQVEVKSVSEELRDNIRKYAAGGHSGISSRIRDLEKEWTREKMLEVNLASFALLGIAFSLISPLFLIVSGLALIFFLQQASKGWCPPLLLLSWLKIRSRHEVEREKYCLKVIRGDFRQFADIIPPKPQLKAKEKHA